MFAIYSLNVITWFVSKRERSLLHKSLISAIFASSSCSPTHCRNHWTNITLGCAGLLYGALLVYKATVPIVLMWGPYNRLLTRKFNLARMKPNMHHVFRFVDLDKICNMKAVAIGMVELWAKFKTKWLRELCYRFYFDYIPMNKRS